MLHTVTELQRRKEKRNWKNVSVKIPQKLSAATSSVHHRMVHPSTVLVLSGFLCPSPFPSHSYDTHLPTKLPFKENKRQEKKKKDGGNDTGQTASHYHNSGNHITVPLRLIKDLPGELVTICSGPIGTLH